MNTVDTTPERAARIAGLSYAAMFVLAVFANFTVLERLVDHDDPAGTIHDLAANLGLLRMAIAAFAVIFVLDVVVAWALHQVLRASGPERSAVAAWFRIVYSAFLAVGLVFLLRVSQLVGDADRLTAGGTDQLDARVMSALDRFDAAWMIGLIAFGIHLLLIGRIMVRSGVAPVALGRVLQVAGVAYVLGSAAYLLLPNYGDHEAAITAVVGVPSVVAEFAFLVWLLRRGRQGRASVTPVARQAVPASS